MVMHRTPDARDAKFAFFFMLWLLQGTLFDDRVPHFIQDLVVQRRNQNL